MKLLDMEKARRIADSFGPPGSGSTPPPEEDEGEVPFDAAALAAEIVEAYERERPDTGGPSVLGDVSKLTIFLRVLSGGNYISAAADAARIGQRTVRRWLELGDAGPADSLYGITASIIRHAEAIGEVRAREWIGRAGRHPQFWAANAWGLERRSPDRWGRRTDDSSVPKVIVQIGVQAGDVQVTLTDPARLALPAAASSDVIDAQS